MSAELLDIQPREIKFVFELKKQSSCTIQLVNKSNNHVAFKVKTTSPKKYCVRPNTGIVKPNSNCDFTVTMQAQRLPPPDMICRDKFLIQSTVVPAGTADEDITSSMFSRDDGRYIDENKLRVVLVSPPNSPVLSPIGRSFIQVPDGEASILTEQVMRKVESIRPHQAIPEDIEEATMENDHEVKPAKVVEYKPMEAVEEQVKDVEYRTTKDAEEQEKSLEYGIPKDVEQPAKDDPAPNVEYKTLKEVYDPLNDVEDKTVKDVVDPTKGMEHKSENDLEEQKLVKDIEEMKSKLNKLELKLSEAEVTISKLAEERRWTAQERETLHEELVMLRNKRDVRKAQVGFPFLFVCTVALISVVLGYLVRG
ncbi:vesicle-associated protein 2-2 [Diospyros lotus]|uniref:vesicle-associated protein 2-2 n=1 Tax=Diospyros lotus TaxID=55363 RepID=UPI0022546A40|nr:vesicle-associated protein 2-2 [Diospyros lotus]XP_052192994.1 vesicle-associated protein 2-2 [Diospyros lotus]